MRACGAENLGRDFYRITDEMPPGETCNSNRPIVRCRKTNSPAAKAWSPSKKRPAQRAGLVEIYADTDCASDSLCEDIRRRPILSASFRDEAATV